MNSNIKKTALGSFFIRLLLCALAFFAFCIICSGICFATKNPTGYIKIFSVMAFLLSGAMTGFLFGKKEKTLSSYLPLIGFAMLLLLLSLMLKQASLPLSVPINLISYLAVGGLFFLLGGSGKEKKKKHRSHYGKR